MRRVIVFGGLGLFGRTIIAELAKLGISSTAASRSPSAPIQCDAENPESLRKTLQASDLVLDAAGPFHLRSIALIEAAVEIGCDVIDINDNLHYAQQVIALESQINTAGIRVLTSASTVSAIAAAIIRHSGITSPTRVTTYLAPATRHTSNPGAALSLLRTVGQPISIWRDGRLQSATGWTESRTFAMPPPVGPIRGRLYESADAVHLPRVWPSLREVTMYVDTNTPGVNAMLSLAVHSPVIRRLLEKSINLATRPARWLGSSSGGVGYEIEVAGGQIARFALVASELSYVPAIAPAILAARAIVDGSFTRGGLVPISKIAEPAALFTFLAAVGIDVTR
jgi:hypothetical protein